MMILVNPEDDVHCRDDGASVQGDFGKGNDGDEDAHQDAQALRVTAGPEDV